MTDQTIPNSIAAVATDSFIRIGLPIIVIFTILETISTARRDYLYLFAFILIPQALFIFFLMFAGAVRVTPKTLTFQRDGIIIVTRKGWFPLLTPARKLSIGYDKISRVYEGSLTTRPAFVLVGARVLPGNWEERYFVTRRIARLLRKNWEAHKLGHAMQ